MSHQSIAAIWTKIEKRTDLGAALREAIGQYAIVVSLGGEDRFAPKSLRAFDYLVNLIKIALHLQRTYLQSRKPSINIQRFLLEPSQVADVLHFLLTVKDSCFQVPDRLDAAKSHVLRSMGGALFSGLRFLTLFKSKVYYDENFDWLSLANSLRSRLQKWPLVEDSLDRFLIRELCAACLDELSLAADLQPALGVHASCGYHVAHSGSGGLVDLPDYNDGLYPLNEGLMAGIAEATNCMHHQCPWWFQSFCAWYDAWSALIAASMQLYSRVRTTNESSSASSVVHRKHFEPSSSFVKFYLEFMSNSPGAGRTSRLDVIGKAMLTLTPFPNCSSDGCDCFGETLPHKYLDVYEIRHEDSADIIDLHHQIAHDLEKRQHILQDPNGRLQQISRSLEEKIRVWTATERFSTHPSEGFLDSKHLASYIVNCPRMHPLTRSTIQSLLEDADESFGIEDIQGPAEIVKVGGIKCPRCRNRERATFSEARLVKPMVDLNEELKAALSLTPRKQMALRAIATHPSTPTRDSIVTEQSPTTSGRSPSLVSRSLWPTPTDHSRSGSGENTSYTSSKGRRSIWRSGSSSPNIHISYALFSDARFVLAYTPNRISCYDCELRSWSEGQSFNGISMAAGSFARYAVISKETTAYTLSVLRRDDENEEWPSKVLPAQPFSLAISRQGHKVAVGFANAIQLYDAALGTLEPLPVPMPPKERVPLTIDSQCISFSVDATHLVVATRETRDGWVYTAVYDLQPGSRSAKQMQNIRIPSHFPRDFHLSSVIYDQSSSTVCICSSTAKGHTWLINSVSTTATAMTLRELHPFPGDQIQCAVVMPGTPPRIALVNDSNNVFILQYLYHESRWISRSVPVKLGKGRKGVNKFDEKMSIAATNDGTIRTFWMQGQEGRLLSIESGQGGPFEPEMILATPF